MASFHGDEAALVDDGDAAVDEECLAVPDELARAEADVAVPLLPLGLDWLPEEPVLLLTGEGALAWLTLTQ